MATRTIIDGGKQAITFNNDTEPVAVYVDGELQQNVSFVPQLAQGTGSAQYTSEYKKNIISLEVSGTTSQSGTPTPETPIAIENANSEGMSITLHGDNLFNQDEMLTDTDFTIEKYNGFDCIKCIPTHVSHYFDVDIPAGTFSFSFEVSHPNTSSDFYIFGVYEDGTTKNLIGVVYSGAYTEFRTKKLTYTITQRIVKLDFRFYSVATFRPYYIKNFMVNTGEPKPYEPYFREEIEVPTSVEVDNGDGTTKTVDLPFTIYDKLIVDRVANTVRYEKKSGVKVFTGNENFDIGTSNVPNAYIYKFPLARAGFNITTANGYCTHFTPVTAENISKIGDVCFILSPTNRPFMSFVFDDFGYSLSEFELAEEEFESWVAEQYSAGTPLTIVVEYEEVESIDITQSSLAQSLLNLATQNQTNYFEITSNEEAPQVPIKINYAKWGELVENNNNT